MPPVEQHGIYYDMFEKQQLEAAKGEAQGRSNGKEDF